MLGEKTRFLGSLSSGVANEISSTRKAALQGKSLSAAHPSGSLDAAGVSEIGCFSEGRVDIDTAITSRDITVEVWTLVDRVLQQVCPSPRLDHILGKEPLN